VKKPAAKRARKAKKPAAIPAVRDKRHARFVEAYAGPGSGPTAARAAGFRGGDRSLAVTASRLLTRPEIRAAIEARGVALPGAEPDPSGRPRGPELDTSSPEAFHRSIVADTTLPLSERRKSMERIEQIQRHSQPGTDAEARLAALRAKIATELRGMHQRARERATAK